MTILYVIDDGIVGGAIHSFVEMISAMKELGVKPIVFTGKKNEFNDYLDGLCIQNIPIGHKTVLEPFFFEGKGWPYRLVKKASSFYVNEYRAIKLLHRSLDFSKVDMIHTNSARNDIGCYINKKYGIPHIMHIREFADADFDCISFRPNYVKFYNKYVTQFITISDAVKQHWIKKGLKREKMKTIYNGIHYEDISQSSDHDKLNSDFHILIAGGVFPTKGQHLAVEALGLLPERILNHLFVDVAGWSDNSYVSYMEKYAADRGYGNRLRFLGAVNNLHSVLGRYQIGLMCSRAEGFGRVTAEYMHAKMGVIASDSGANPELIENGINGLLFKSGDAKSLANCIIKMYNNREMLIRLSNAAHNKARELYSQQKNAENIYNLYREILKF